MKKNLKIVIMAATAIATIGFSACDRGDGPAPDEVRDAVLKVTLINPPSNTRVGGPAPDAGQTVKDYSIFVVNSNGDVAWSKYVSGVDQDISKRTTYIEVTTDAKAIYGIANAGTDLHATYKTRAELESADPLVETLSSQYTNRWATGLVDGSGWTFQSNDSNGNGLLEQEVALELKFIAARIRVTVDNNMAGYDGSSPGTVKITNVAVLNARGQSRLFPGSGNSLIPNTYSPADQKYRQGIAKGAFANFPADADYSVETAGTGQLNNAYVYSGADTPTYSHFYVFENDADELTEYPTIVTLVGTDVNGDPAYFPVHFASYETWANNAKSYAGGIVRGNSYDVTITLNGKATQGKGGGTGDPTVNVKNVEVKATISIVPWTLIELGKNF